MSATAARSFVQQHYSRTHQRVPLRDSPVLAMVGTHCHFSGRVTQTSSETESHTHGKCILINNNPPGMMSWKIQGNSVNETKTRKFPYSKESFHNFAKSQMCSWEQKSSTSPVDSGTKLYPHYHQCALNLLLFACASNGICDALGEAILVPTIKLDSSEGLGAPCPHLHSSQLSSHEISVEKQKSL